MSGSMIRPDVARATFAMPTIETLRTLGAFASFISYVFTRAGYDVQPASQGSPATFQLFVKGGLQAHPVAFVTVKTVDGYNVGATTVAQLQNQLGTSNAKGYLITNADFNQDARKQAATSPSICLLDCKLLKRYIDYVRGSRDEYAKTPPIAPDAFAEADTTWRWDRSRTRVLTVANNKGGEGKTTTSLYLAKRLGEQNKRVLLVDVDAQANLSHTLTDGSRNGDYRPSLVDYFQGCAELAQLIQGTQLSNVWLIPSDVRLRLVTTGTATDPDLELRFLKDVHNEAIHPQRGPQDDTVFDWIIIDTPPDMSLLTRCALSTAHYVVAPTSPGPFAESGLQQLFDTIGAIRGLTLSDVRLMGCLITKWQDNAYSREAVANLQLGLAPRGIQLFETYIPFDSNVVRDERERLRIPGLSKKPASAKYSEFAQEVITYDSNA